MSLVVYSSGMRKTSVQFLVQTLNFPLIMTLKANLNSELEVSLKIIRTHFLGRGGK